MFNSVMLKALFDSATIPTICFPICGYVYWSLGHIIKLDSYLNTYRFFNAEWWAAAFPFKLNVATQR